MARRVEAEKLSRSLRMPIAKFAEETNRLDGFPFEFKKINGECIFHHNDKCTVYPLRPLTCRVYPFWIEHHGRRFSFNVTNECPEVGCGPKLSRFFFERLLQKA
ncbi:MAG: YkgJ family cysteine cluster protein, partial [Candidatus Bathyarchaeia archaeon]